jgi:hypothetical protein
MDGMGRSRRKKEEREEEENTPANHNTINTMVSLLPIYCESHPPNAPPLHQINPVSSQTTKKASKQAIVQEKKHKSKKKKARKEKKENKSTHAIAPQFPIIVATVASLALNPLLLCKYVGYKSWLPCAKKLNPVINNIA